ncbi:MAG TPA: M28 family peptidase [Pyrinomonadaceae bacterium]|nr:M28 family peptidase [Pyrinomonadaceae bacterium]
MLLLLVMLGFAGLLAGAWFAVTQPVMFPGSPGDNSSRPPVDVARLEAHVRMLSETFAPRDEGHPENLGRVAAYLRKEFERANAVVSEQPFTSRGQTYRNVIASFGPRTNEMIVVGAHYDTAGALPGADDNASGVAGLIELAYLLGRTPPAARIELVAFALEEPPYFRSPLMGSAVHAASLKSGGFAVRAMLSLEMIGYFSDQPDSQQYPVSVLKAFYPSRGNFIAVIGKIDQGHLVRRVKKAMMAASPLAVSSINAPRSIPGVDFSDHLNYWNEGYDALMITDTAFYRNPHYHTSADTHDTLDYQRMAMVVQGVYAAVLSLTN